MDNSIYLAMHGAQHALKAQKVHTNNLANINVPGFKADVLFAQASEQADHKLYPITQATRISAKAGAMEQTNDVRDLSLTDPKQWFVLKTATGEVLTRNVRWQVSSQGELTDRTGRNLLSASGESITVNNFKKLEISDDGRVSLIPADNGNEFVEVAKLQVVSVNGGITKRFDGTFIADANADVRIESNPAVLVGYQEGSNVSSMATMTEMMDLNRYFENQMAVMKDIKEAASLATKLLDLG